MALGLGVRVFEKHITLDRALGLIDNISALPPAEFGEYVASLRRLSYALGNPSLELSELEIGYRERAIKRVVAARDLSAGTVLGEGDLLLSRPVVPEGLFRLEDAIGHRLNRDIAKGKAITVEELG